MFWINLVWSLLATVGNWDCGTRVDDTCADCRIECEGAECGICEAVACNYAECGGQVAQ